MRHNVVAFNKILCDVRSIEIINTNVKIYKHNL